MVKSILSTGAIITALTIASVAGDQEDINSSVKSFVKNIVSEKTQGLVSVNQVDIVEVLTLDETDSFEGYKLKIKTSAKDPETDKNISQSEM